MQGQSLRGTVADDRAVREAGLFGIHGGHVNVTDGRYVYMRAPAETTNRPLFQYTLMPTRHGSGRAFISNEELATMELSPPFSFTKGLSTLKTETKSPFYSVHFTTQLFDLMTDPYQEHPIRDPGAEERMISLLIRLMQANDAPAEQYVRLGLTEYLSDKPAG
jgi:hypothetical protein